MSLIESQKFAEQITEKYCDGIKEKELYKKDQTCDLLKKMKSLNSFEYSKGNNKKMKTNLFL